MYVLLCGWPWLLPRARMGCVSERPNRTAKLSLLYRWYWQRWRCRWAWRMPFQASGTKRWLDNVVLLHLALVRSCILSQCSDLGSTDMQSGLQPSKRRKKTGLSLPSTIKHLCITKHWLVSHQERTFWAKSRQGCAGRHAFFFNGAKDCTDWRMERLSSGSLDWS